MTTSSLPGPRWGTLKHLAVHRGVSERSARNWASAGYLVLYKARGVQGVVVDIDEADKALDALIDKGLIRPNYGSFGGQVIRDLVTEVQR